MRFNPHTKKEMGRVLDSLTAQIRDNEKRQLVIWEKTLRLHVNAKPAFMPRFVWAWLVNLVLTQSASVEALQGNKPMPERTFSEAARHPITQELIDNEKNTQKK